MLNKPITIATILTVLGGLPLLVLSSQQFEISFNNLPVIALSLFTLLSVCAYWSSKAVTSSADHSDPGDDPGDPGDPDNPGDSDDHDMDRESGEVKWFNESKGFGFITRDSGEDVFVHFRSIRGSGHRVLQDGQRVEFAVIEGEKGLQAEDVAIDS